MMQITNNGWTLEDVMGLVKNKNNKPKLDLYGVKLLKTNNLNKKGLVEKMHHVKSTTLVKECPHCKSRNIKKGFRYYGNYADSPDLYTKEIRRVFVDLANGYDCFDCKMPIMNDLHMFNREFGITNRLYEYIESNMNKKSLAEVIKATGISFELAYDISMNIYKKNKS